MTLLFNVFFCFFLGLVLADPDSDLRATLGSEVAQNELPNLAAFVTKGCETEFYITNATDCTVYLWASVSKLFTWTALTILLDEGRFQLNDTVTSHVGFPVVNPNFPDSPVLMEHLYTHRTQLLDTYGDEMYGFGLENCPFEIDLKNFSQSYVSVSSNWNNMAPGSTEEYSNSATGLAGVVVSELSGLSFEDFCQTRIFDPLGMSSTAWHYESLAATQLARMVPLYDSPGEVVEPYCFVDYPSGQILSPIVDIAKFIRSMAHYGEYQSGNETLRLYSLETAQQAFTERANTSWGLGWGIDADGLSHSGSESGAATEVWIDPVNGVGAGIAVSMRDAGYESAFAALKARAKNALDLPSSASCVAQQCDEAPTPTPTPNSNPPTPTPDEAPTPTPTPTPNSNPPTPTPGDSSSRASFMEGSVFAVALLALL